MARPKGMTLTRESVVAAAVAGLQSHGLEGFGINRVAHDLGIKPPSLYNHVASNEDLRQATALAGYQLLARRFEAIAEAGLEGAETLRRFADAFRTFARENPGLFTLMATVRVREEGGPFPPELQRVLDVLGRVLVPMGLEGEETIHAVMAMRAAMQGFVMLELSGHVLEAPTLTRSYEWLVDALISAVTARSPRRNP